MKRVLVHTAQLHCTLLCCFINCKLAVQFKLGLQRLAQLGYSNVHWWGVIGLIKSKTWVKQLIPVAELNVTYVTNIVLYNHIIMLLTSIIFNIITIQYIIYLEEPPCADRSKPNFKQCKCEDGTVIHHKGVKKHKVGLSSPPLSSSLLLPLPLLK